MFNHLKILDSCSPIRSRTSFTGMKNRDEIRLITKPSILTTAEDMYKFVKRTFNILTILRNPTQKWSGTDSHECIALRPQP